MSKTHGMTNSRIYHIYHDMKQRCYNPKQQSYRLYGERGITVCDEWLDKNGFLKFNEWAMANGYADNLTIDRIDVNKGYSPKNCRWVTNYVQCRNKRNNVWIGDTILSDYAKEVGVNKETIRYRRSKNKPLNSKPKHRLVNYNGKKISLSELSELTGINVNTLQTRMTKGYSDEEMVLPYMSKIKKRVIQYSLDGKEISRYEGVREASRISKISYSGIASCCGGKRNTCGGYLWKYEEVSDGNKPNDRVETP